MKRGNRSKAKEAEDWNSVAGAQVTVGKRCTFSQVKWTASIDYLAMAMALPMAMAMANFAFEGNINFSNDWLSKMTMNVWHQQCSPAWGKQSPSTSSSITLWSSSSSSLLCCPGSSAPLLHSGQQISKGKYVHCLLPLSVSLFARQSRADRLRDWEQAG